MVISLISLSLTNDLLFFLINSSFYGHQDGWLLCGTYPNIPVHKNTTQSKLSCNKLVYIVMAAADKT